MTSKRFRALSFLTLVGAAGPLAGCSESADVDLGALWVPASSKIEAFGWTAWSPDASTLLWVGVDEERGTRPLVAMTRANGPLSLIVPDTGDGPGPQMVDGARTVFFTKREPAIQGAILLRSSVSDGVASVPVEVTRDVFSYLAAPDGAHVVVQNASVAGPPRSIDVASGTVVDLRESFIPVVFSPDGTRLLMRNGTSDDPAASEHYALVDPATGASENVPFPENDSINAVVRRDGTARASSSVPFPGRSTS